MMNVTSLYVSTCRYILLANPDDVSTWADLYRLLPYLRQALSCCVCGNLLMQPMGPRDSVCQHHVCKLCLGGKMKLKPSCSWCKDQYAFVENVHLRIALRCYKKLCSYLVCTSIYQNLGSTNGGTNSIAEMILEGKEFKDSVTEQKLSKYEFLKSNEYLTLASFNVGQSEQKIILDKPKNLPEVPILIANACECYDKNNLTLYSVTMSNENRPKIKIKRKWAAAGELNIDKNAGERTIVDASSESEDQADEVDTFKKVKRSEDKYNMKAKKVRCRCGLTTFSSGKLTCCGQHCACYVVGKKCTNCRCRGCRNRYKIGNSSLSATDKVLLDIAAQG